MYDQVWQNLLIYSILILYLRLKNWVNMCTDVLIRGKTLPSDVNERELSL